VETGVEDWCGFGILKSFAEVGFSKFDVGVARLSVTIK